jgi:hypothetical protein
MPNYLSVKEASRAKLIYDMTPRCRFCRKVDFTLPARNGIHPACADEERRQKVESWGNAMARRGLGVFEGERS